VGEVEVVGSIGDVRLRVLTVGIVLVIVIDVNVVS
jgi:hypothetical protein